MPVPNPVLPSPASRAALRRAHFDALHPPGSVGRAFVGSKVVRDGKAGFDGVVADHGECHEFLGPETSFVSLNRFWGRSRAGTNLKAVGSFALDFDFFHAGLPYAALSAVEIADMLVDAIVAAGIPRPSIDVSSGRGVQLTWICDGARASAWARVRAVYDALHGPSLDSAGMPVRSRRHRDDAVLAAFDARMAPMWRLFRDCGLDRCVRDAARVVRLVGAINATNGRMATLMFPSAFQDIVRYEFGALADAILPYSRARIQEMRAARAEAQADMPANDNPAPRRVRRLPAGYWPNVLADLHRLRAHRGGIAQGYRRIWLFLTANATAHINGGCPADWAADLAHLAGLSEAEATECLRSLGRRQVRNEAGERDTWDKKEWSVLYNYSAAEMVRLLNVMVEEADEAGLRQLVPGGAIARTDAERQADKRLRAGVATSGDKASRKLVDGLAGLDMKAEGKTLAEISAVTGRGRTSLIEAMREAKEYQASATTDSDVRADAKEDISETTVRVESRYMWSVGPRVRPAPEPAPVAAPFLPSAPAGAIRIRRWTRYHATVETASGSWSWTVPADDGMYRSREAWWTLDSDGAPSEADRALADAARLELDIAFNGGRRIVAGTSGRRPASSRSTSSQARRVPLAPHAKPAVAAEWDNNYWRASRGG